MKQKIQSKVPSYFQIGIQFPDGKKVVKSKCTMEEVFETYFINLEKLRESVETPEELFEKYQEKYEKEGIKVAINYSDSWGHMWKGKKAWPIKDRFIEYLNRKMK